jgi:acyl-homoserine-lactone acylase
MTPATRLLLGSALAAAFPCGATAQQIHPLAQQVEIRRTAHGVPHILGENLEAAAFGLAWCMLEDYGARVARGLIAARGELALASGEYDAIESDLDARPAYEHALATFHLLDEDTRAVYRGFAMGVGYYVATHPEEFPEWMPVSFTAHDVLARDITDEGGASANAFVRRLRAGERATAGAGAVDEYDWRFEEGSNTWAFAPSRTASGHAILMRNPHLSWTSGYYEAHVRVPGVLDFYGDYRIGGPFGVIGGFNPFLGWSTTNNAPDLDEIYVLDADPARANHYLFDGASVPLLRRSTTVHYRAGDALIPATRETWSSALGPVIHRDSTRIWIVRRGGAGDHRAGQQWLAMMKARSLVEWQDAMRIRARASSNFTYADRDGNIFYVWNGTVPALPHVSGGDTLAIPATTTADVWTRLVPFDSLPQVLNPRGGYLHNENDPFHFTNLNDALRADAFPPHYPEPELSLRSQHGVLLIRGDDRLTLEEVVRRKHSYRMILAERVKADLVRAVRASGATGEVAAAADLMDAWDGTVAPESRGGLLFDEWWTLYLRSARALATDSTPPRATPANAGYAAPAGTLFALPWTPEDPLAGPSGLADPARAARTFADAVRITAERWGAWDVAWGDVHRVRRGDVDVPVGGCGGGGCFRVLRYATAEDGKRVANSGDGWILAIEFDDTPRAYSILAYGQSPDPASPWHADQAAMFARGELKPVAFTEDHIAAALARSYRPGER